jgi:surfeit locus 1 family protein
VNPARREPLSITLSGIAGTLLIVALAAVCVRLGFWQLDRLHERRERNAALVARLDAAPIVLDHLVADTAGLAWRHGAAAGTYDDDRTIVLPGRSFRGTPGVHVLTPLVVGDSIALLVNRGWLPAADGATVDLEGIRTAGATRVSGVVLAFPGRAASLVARPRAEPAAAGAPEPFRRVWFSIDEAALRRQFPYRLIDLELQLLPAEDAPRFPVRLPPPQLDDGPHVSYAIQWFSFALIAIGGWIALVLNRGGRGAVRRRPG